MPKYLKVRYAFVIPCLNESRTIADVVRRCREALPAAAVFVFDNASVDDTAEVARTAGATVIRSPLKGKGHALRHAFQALDADYYIMVDGDGTYPVEETPRLLKQAEEFNYEMVVGARLQNARPEAFRPMHFFGNRLFTGVTRVLFSYPVQDLLSGFRVFSRRFVDEVCLVSEGFEVETEITLRAIVQGMSFAEIPIEYVQRPPCSSSKLRTFRDGFKILKMIAKIFVFKLKNRSRENNKDDAGSIPKAS